MSHDDSVPDVLPFVQPPFHTNGHSSKQHIPVITVPRLAPQTFVHPDDGHWLKLPDGMIQMALTEPVAVVRVVLLVLQRQNDDAVTGVGKELGVVRCYLLECLGGVVMKVRSSVPASSEHRNLESIHVFQPWIIYGSRDQRTPRIGAGNPLFLRRARIEDELADRVVRRIEFGHANAQEPLTRWNWRRRRNEGRRKFVGLVH